MIEAPTPCDAHVDLVTLSAWRDRAVSITEYRRLTDHIAVCSACQYRLRTLDHIGQSLQSPDTDAYQERIWHGLQAKMQRPAVVHFTLAPRLVAAISVLVIIALFALVGYQGHFLQNKQTMATATPTPTVLPNIWQAVPAIQYAVAITFAQSDLQTGYVCGNPDSTADTLKLGVTHDAGLTWTTSLLAGIPGNYCQIAVSPYDADDIVLVSQSCSQGCFTTNILRGTYRSRDGGKTWAKLVVPPGNEASDSTIPVSPVWTPTALFVLTALTNPNGKETAAPAHAIAVSVNGGPLAWTQANPAIPVPANHYSYSIFTLGDNINFMMTQPNRTDLTDQFTSSNNGASWVHITPKGLLPTIGTIQIAADKHTVIGVHDTLQGNDITDQQAVVSADGGKTWSASTAFPKNSALWGGGVVFATTLDGSMFTALTPFRVSDVQQGIYDLAPGGTSWVFIAPLVGEGDRFVAVSGDGNGHPTLVWASIYNSATSSSILEYHPIR